jgi:murein DD-endopeptidase MepM/ murein hydrolase activator NlpD
MSTIYEMLRCKRGGVYREENIKGHSLLRLMPKIKKMPGALAGNSRVHGDASPEVQDRIIDIIIEIGARYKLSFRDVAYILLMCKLESGFNPDAAAGTSSAGGLGQYTEATVEEARDKISKPRLRFVLDLSGYNIFDAELGAYGLVLSYMFSKERATGEVGARNAEKYIYIHHHESWYFKPTAAHMASHNVKEVIKLRDASITPHLAILEKMLAEKTPVAFKLISKDDKPLANQPYVAIHHPASTGKKPTAVQGAQKGKATAVLGRTDGEGKTQPVETSSMAEVIFVILKQDYQLFLDVNKTADNNVHVVKKNETLAKIAKEEGVTVEELQRLNKIKDANKISEGQKLVLHSGDYLWRRPSMDLVGEYLRDLLNMNPAATSAIVEHKRSHINLPNGNASQQHGPDKNVVAIRAGATTAKIEEKKKTKDIPHKTVEKKIQKVVPVAPVKTSGPVKEGLLFPMKMRPSASYHTDERAYGVGRKGPRKHAGCDIWAPVGTEVRAMADGVVVQCYDFYNRTDALDVIHGDFIVRYGEVAPRSKSERLAMAGKQVKRGDVLGKVGTLYFSGKPYKHSMLHLEMYSSNKSPLVTGLTNKQSAGLFKRRDDLMDPTATLDKCVLE